MNIGEIIKIIRKKYKKKYENHMNTCTYIVNSFTDQECTNMQIEVRKHPKTYLH